jgi:uridine kinase
MQSVLIGIAGPSGAGKSELARQLEGRLPGTSSLVSLDSYYLPLTHLSIEERTRVNFDDPAALDWSLIRADVRRLASGRAIEEPVYLFDQHTRAAEARIVEPADFVIIEGLFILHDPLVREALDATIFVEAPGDVCLSRRLARDVVERGRSPESVMAQYAATVRPMAEKYVLPTKRHADLVVSGLNPIEESIAAVKDLLRQAA